MSSFRKPSALACAMFFSLAAGLAARIVWQGFHRPPPLPVEAALKVVFPEAASFGPPNGKPSRREALGAKGERLGIVFVSTDVLPDARGYAGPIHILVGLKADGTLAGIDVLRHNETPSYTGPLGDPAWLGAYAGKAVADPFRPGQDVDAISRATITSETVARSVRDASRIMARDVLGLDVPPPAGSTPVPWARMAAVGAIILAAVIIHFVARATMRVPLLLLSAAGLGFGLSVYISLGQLANLLLGRGIIPSQHPEWYLLFAAALILGIAVGNLFCASLCPFGALQELLARLVGRVAGARRTAWPEANRLRYVFLWAALMAAFVLGTADAVNYEPFGTIFDRKGGLLNWALLICVGIGAAVVPRFWCRWFCPVGVVMQFVSSISPRGRRNYSLQRDILEQSGKERAAAVDEV